MTSEQVVMLSIACATCNEGPHLLEILCRNVSEDHFLFIEHLRNINLLHTLVNSHTLNLYTIEAVIAKMRENFLKLHQKFKMSETLKLHVIFSHYLEYFHMTGHTLLKYTDEVTEAVHSQLRMFEERHQYKRNNKESAGYAKAQHNQQLHCILQFCGLG